MNEDTGPTGIMQKRIDDLTLGDTLKINLVILAAIAAIPAAVIAGVSLKNRIVDFRSNRKSKKTVTIIPSK